MNIKDKKIERRLNKIVSYYIKFNPKRIFSVFSKPYFLITHPSNISLRLNVNIQGKNSFYPLKPKKSLFSIDLEEKMSAEANLDKNQSIEKFRDKDELLEIIARNSNENNLKRIPYNEGAKIRFLQEKQNPRRYHVWPKKELI